MIDGPLASPDGGDAVGRWLDDLARRHLADMTPTEVARALRALSSTYVERRTRLSGRGAFDSAGKRAAYALYYTPRRYLFVAHVLRALDHTRQARQILDLGCGTGAAGAAWARQVGPEARVLGVDVHPWALEEARAAYAALGIHGTARRAPVTAALLTGGAADRRRDAPAQAGIVASYVLNELTDDGRAALLPRILAAADGGAQVLVVEPLSRRTSPWWTAWARTIEAAGGRADEWRLAGRPPDPVRALGRAAGLDPDTFTGRTLWLR